MSPRKDEPDSFHHKFLLTQFKEVDADEKVDVTFACALKLAIPLQGMLYLTSKAVYFYSPFSKDFGKCTALKLSLDCMVRIEKVAEFKIFDNGINFVMDDA